MFLYSSAFDSSLIKSRFFIGMDSLTCWHACFKIWWMMADDPWARPDRKSVVQGKGVDLGGRRIIKEEETWYADS